MWRVRVRQTLVAVAFDVDRLRGVVLPYSTSELKEDDYEMITAEIDDLHWRALQWYGANRAGVVFGGVGEQIRGKRASFEHGGGGGGEDEV